jgi:putative protease
MNKNNIEIMSPVGSYESLMAAIKAGADSVYFGIEHLTMRARAADNFNLDDLKKIVSLCKKNKVKTYLALNTLVYDGELKLMKKICDAAKKAKITAVIATDISTISYAHSIGLEVHISVQANVSNIEAVKFYAHYADAVVLARELTLKQIKEICMLVARQRIKGPNGKLIRIELFAHGALCVAISGKCYMSLATYNAPANRGICLQNCRRAYRVIDEETGDELKIDNKYVMSPKDLCTIGFLDKILEAGVSILKIEGRGKGAEYTYTTTKIYKEAVESYFQKTYTKDKIKKWTKGLETIYNRGFWQGGYYLGKKLGEWSGIESSRSTKIKTFVGIVENYYNKKNVAEIHIQAGQIKKGDEVLITGPTTGVASAKVTTIRSKEGSMNLAKKGTIITIPFKEKVRRNDKTYVLTERTDE